MKTPCAQIKQCPEHPGFRFRTQCTISSCKFFTEHTKNRCMALDTVFTASEKGITDSELCVLKFPEHDKKTVFSIRKSAQDRVHAIMVLHQFAKHCEEHESQKDGFPYIKHANPLVDRLVKTKVFKLRLLGLKPWMLKFLCDDSYVRKVCPMEVKFHTLFKLKPKELEEIKTYVKENSQ